MLSQSKWLIHDLDGAGHKISIINPKGSCSISCVPRKVGGWVSLPWTQRTILLFFDSAAAHTWMSVCLCGFPLCFQSALELALISTLLRCVEHLILRSLPHSRKESWWLQHGVRILTGGMSTCRSAIAFVVGLGPFLQFQSVTGGVALRTRKAQWGCPCPCPCFTRVEWQSFPYPPIFPHCRVLGRSQEQGTQWAFCCTTWKKVVSQTVLWPAQPPENKEHFGSWSTKARSGEQKAGKHASNLNVSQESWT